MVKLLLKLETLHCCDVFKCSLDEQNQIGDFGLPESIFCGTVATLGFSGSETTLLCLCMSSQILGHEHDQNAKKSYFLIHIALSTNYVLKSAPGLAFFNKPRSYVCLKLRPSVSPKIQELLAQLILSDMVTTHTGLLTNVCSFIAMRKVPCVTFMDIP